MQGIARAIVDQLGYHVSILVVLAIGVYQGIQVKTFILEIPGFLIQIVTVEAIPATVTFSIVLLVSGILLLLDTLQADNDTKTPNTTPTIMAIIPAYQANNVLHNSIKSLKQSTYPCLEIVIVTEPDDTPTREAAIQFSSEPGVHVITN